MRFLSYRHKGVLDWGMLDDSHSMILPSRTLFQRPHKTLLEYIKDPQRQKPAPAPDALRLPLETVTLLSPIPWPARNIFCVGKNYEDHIQEVRPMEPDQIATLHAHPVFFTKATGTMNGPHATVPLHDGVTSFLDYEVELAVVLGARCLNADEAAAREAVFGYTVYNDFTARDIQKRSGQWFQGKSLDGTGPMGPFLVTPEELPEDLDLSIRCLVNGEVRQNATTGQMIHAVPRLLSHLSQGLTLEPGDIVATGTPSGVGAGRKPPCPLKAKDVVRSEIAFLGALENIVDSSDQ